ncbi:acyl carrier protein [Streptomyces sp. HD]|uniref:acyl carrier protein n=1 Tax=Streptomyces sp. HD TaxID=3020892 RepID=UPI00232E7A11|nr:phosphopantetheine-binding protein [Streptomyces sp. HD]MDC0770683.1 phosphopantetheine-binding protein [Streptomyces sp. HD]
MDHVYDHLVTLLRDKFEVDPGRIGPDSTLDALDLDSLAVVELYVTLQEEWRVPLDDSAASADLTLTEVARAVAALLATGESAPGHGTSQ